MQVSERVDVVVIGGGIIGCACAYYLGSAGLRVVLLEKDRVGAHQSGQNAGWIRLLGRDREELPLMVESHRLWAGVENDLEADVEWIQEGSLALAETPEDVASLERWLADVPREYADLAQWVEAGDIENLVALDGQWAAALWAPADGHADPVKATTAFANAASRVGVAIRTGVAATRIVVSGGAVQGVETSASGRISADVVICAAGVASARLLRGVNVNVPTNVVRFTMARSAPIKRVTGIAVSSRGMRFRQAADGSLVIAGAIRSDYDLTLESFRNMRTFIPAYWANRHNVQLHFGPLMRDMWKAAHHAVGRAGWRDDLPDPPPPNRVRTRRSVERLSRLMPSIAPIGPVDIWAGYIDVTPDGLPVLGAVPTNHGAEGLYVATGFCGHGFGLAPGAARMISDLVLGGSTSIDITPFRVDRFASGALRKSRALL